MSPIKKKLLIIGILMLVVGLPIIKKTVGSHSSKSVVVEALAKREIRSSTLASGTLVHEDKVLISTEVIGRVKSVLVEEGDWVEKGQLLLQVDDTNFVAAVDQVQALVKMQEIDVERKNLRIKNLRKNWQRKEKLFKENILDESSFDAISHELELAEANLKFSLESLNQSKAQFAQAQDRFNKTHVFSPLKGIVTSLDIKEGEMAISSTINIAGSSLMTIADPESIHAEVYIDEADIANIKIGQEVEIHAIAYPETAIKGIVESIASTAKVAYGRQGLSFEVEIQFTDTAGIELKPGMSCRAEIFTNENEKVLAVPVQAIQSYGNDNLQYIFIEKNQVAKKVIVTTGISDDDYQQVSIVEQDEVQEVLSEGINIIIGSDRVLRSLVDGDTVEISELKKSTSSEEK